ncbi:MAG TPA: amidohydrolase/deacetylase family metallohydrolase [Bacteroidales bacterium]|nr:amidohydrolase/deacetylase family metallohydrolase [Bacteroidales bacterium]HNR40873.1 amidohydrolase/deacetylase family metallohydrolase [Bacteroidales bacterium]HPM17691.1 amidohydrolase/deacetylase family metallohydrolase [Bacteroidales bacterium]HQG78168.1 amidohydrolase/deacetylase family metallohydrolase [Bacteroidales bacterium]
MKRVSVLIIMLFFVMAGAMKAQTYNIVIKGGHVIDPKNNINEVMDVAVKDGKIAKLAKNIDAKEGIQVVNAQGLYVTPGLIDIHVHVYQGNYLNQQYMNGPNCVTPDGFTFRVGVTTVVDAGCAGWRTFPDFKRQTIDRSQTRVLAMLNICGEGMRGDPFEQNLKDMDAKLTGEFALKNSKDIVGIKLAHFSGPDWTPTDRAVEAGEIANMPVMIDFGGSNPPLSIEELFFKHLRPGDIFTHCYASLGNSRESVVDEKTGKLKPFVLDAQKRGIVFDIGYGGISFAYSQAIPAIKGGLLPNAISTDLHIGSMNAAMKDMLTTMSKCLAMGMDLQSVIRASTSDPARIIKREELGNLSEGSEADIAILNLRKGKFGLFDYTGYKIEADRKLECEMTIRAGRIVYDLNGIADPIVLARRPR